VINLVFGKKVSKKSEENFEKQISKLSNQELKELLMINNYKLAILRSQVEAISSILIKKKLTTYEEIWNKTNENIDEPNL